VLPDIPPVVEASEPDFVVAFDAINHVGTGSMGILERIAAQVEGSGLFTDSFLRRLEVVGHIDVARDDFLHPVEWAVNQSTLVPTSEGRWVLVGSRSSSLLEKIASVMNGDSKIVTSVDADLSRVELVGELPLDDLIEFGVAVLDESPAKLIAQSLPVLSEVSKSLKRVTVPKFRTAEFWDTASASWKQTDSLSKIGGYRLKDFASNYAIRA
jgi:hypothetical protein